MIEEYIIINFMKEYEMINVYSYTLELSAWGESCCTKRLSISQTKEHHCIT